LTWGDGNLFAFYSAINLPAKSLSIYTGCKTGMLPFALRFTPFSLNRQDACSTKSEFSSCGTGILPVQKRLSEKGATSKLNRLFSNFQLPIQ
ncbi:hypothetical protein QUB33_11190, partial [Microcoleus sp. B3-A4]|uniref:hypothetical protein n=1 Tax=Microcoleus sp. B3-A4 TaxID=2818653 RepID=UPI003B150C9E